MTDVELLLQYVYNERSHPPKGRRILQDGTLQATAPDNALPGPDDLLERDRVLTWQDERRLSADEVRKIKEAIEKSGFFDLLPRILINYCKEDPPTTIWTVNVDGHKGRVVLYDPKPKRSPELDQLLEWIAPIVGK